MPNVSLPDGKVVAFPDDMPKEEIRALIAHKFPQAASKLKSAAGGVASTDKPFDTTGLAMPGTEPPPGAPAINEVPPNRHFGFSSSDTLNPLPALAAVGDSAAANVPIAGPYLTSTRDKANAAIYGDTPEQARADINETVKQNPEAKVVGAIAGRTAPFAAASVVGGPIAAALGLEGSLGMRLLMGGTSGEAINFGDELAHGEQPLNALKKATTNTLAELPFYALGGAGKKGDTIKAAPTVEDLKSAAKPLYDAAEKSDLLISQPFVQHMVDGAASRAMSKGLDQTLTPKAVAAVKRLQDIKGSNLTIKDAMTVREVLGAAATKSLDSTPKDHALAVGLLHDFDTFLEGVSKKGPQGQPHAGILRGDAEAAHSNLKEANALWSRAQKGKMLDVAIESAVAKAATKDTSLDKALRSEFGSIEQDIIRGDLPGFTPKEIKAIKDVAHGSGAQKLAKTIGKLKAGGLGGVSSAATSGGFVGHLASGGNTAAAALGAGVGGGLAALTGGAGMAGRSMARRISARDAQLASAVSRGPALTGGGNALQPSRLVRSLPGNVGRAATSVTLTDLMRQPQPATAQ